jgi:hypothetical protein
MSDKKRPPNPMTRDEETREKFFSRLSEGASIATLVKELNVGQSTLYNWKKARELESGPIPRTETEGPPDVESPGTISAAKPSRNGKKKSGPITEETAGQLLGGMSLFFAIFSGEPLLMLDTGEQKQLAPSFADSLALIPNPIADAVNTYAAPGIFLSGLGAIYAKKIRLINEKKALQRRGVAPAAAQRVVEQANPNPNAPPQTPATPTDMAAAAAAAAAAAKGSLTSLDGASEGEELLG